MSYRTDRAPTSLRTAVDAPAENPMLRARALRCLAPLLCLAATASGCGLIEAFSKPSFESVAAVLTTTMPTAYAASAAMLAANGEPVDGVIAIDACSDFPCLKLVEVVLDDDVLPIRLRDSGVAHVAGRWKSPDEAVMSVTFIGLRAGTVAHPVRKVALVYVRRRDRGLEVRVPDFGFSIVRGERDVVGPDPIGLAADLIRLDSLGPADFGPSVAMGAWEVEIDDAGTPLDLIDDEFELSGFGQVAVGSADAARFYQLVLNDLLVAPECTLNPVDGDGYLLDVGFSDGFLLPQIEAVGQAVFGFEPKCDGKLRLEFGMGTFMFRSFQKVPLGT